MTYIQLHFLLQTNKRLKNKPSNRLNALILKAMIITVMNPSGE
jgi:hypothetical protein